MRNTQKGLKFSPCRKWNSVEADCGTHPVSGSQVLRKLFLPLPESLVRGEKLADGDLSKDEGRGRWRMGHKKISCIKKGIILQNSEK